MQIFKTYSSVLSYQMIVVYRDFFAAYFSIFAILANKLKK